MNNDPEDLTRIVLGFRQQRVLVVGDVMLDKYWYGQVSRISPEAPVPIVLKTAESSAPGGAANTAANAASLGAQVTLIAVVGQDNSAEELRQALLQANVDCSGLVVDPGRPTTRKTRIIAHHQHALRLDEESDASVHAELEDEIVRRVRDRVAQSTAVILSDYSKGVLSASCLERLIALCRDAPVLSFVDPKGPDIHRYARAGFIKPNRAELAGLSGRAVATHCDVIAAGCQMLRELDGSSLLITEGEEGMTLLRNGAEPLHLQGETRSVFDVTGAGDTVMAAFALAVAAGADPPVAAFLANRAAGLVVQKLGTTALSSSELLRSVMGVSGASNPGEGGTLTHRESLSRNCLPA